MAIRRGVFTQPDGRHHDQIHICDRPDWSLFDRVAGTLEVELCGTWSERRDSPDERYWDLLVGEARLTLHLQHFLGITLYPTAGADADAVSLAELEQAHELLASRDDQLRARPMATISFTAERVATHVEDFTDTFRVYGVYFEAGDPEADGEAWNFTRSFEDDDGVCTVREVQRATLYDGIQSLTLSRARLICTFERDVEEQAGCARLEIEFNIDDATWEKVAQMMDTVCSSKAFYRRS